MRILIMLMVILLMTGCGFTKMTYEEDGGVSWESRTLWKDVKDADIEWGDLHAKLGVSEGNGREEMIACMIAPQLCK